MATATSTWTNAVASGGSTHDFSMTPAPTILLVDADTCAGWFFGWPVHNFFQWSLDQENYLYDVWRIQYLGFNDTQVMPDGSIGYGIPSPTTLSAYDLVIWAHGGGNWWPIGSTVGMGADDELMAYLDGGGRLIISGQDIGWSDDGTTFYDDYLHADYVMDAAGTEGDTVFGSGFLDGLHLEITNASLHGYPNGATGLWPDAAAPADGAAFPVLTYDNGNGVAALAVDPCGATYRAVYFALGYEIFFFQAEDGIRDSVASRGLGDVYKRQIYRLPTGVLCIPPSNWVWRGTHGRLAFSAAPPR